jgi:hypothetical protein
MTWPVLASYQRRFRFLGGQTELNHEITRQVLGLDLAAFLPPKAEEGAFIVAHDDPGIRAADEIAAINAFDSDRA